MFFKLRGVIGMGLYQYIAQVVLEGNSSVRYLHIYFMKYMHDVSII